jgi:hypothetical protein
VSPHRASVRPLWFPRLSSRIPSDSIHFTSWVPPETAPGARHCGFLPRQVLPNRHGSSAKQYSRPLPWVWTNWRSPQPSVTSAEFQDGLN